MARSTYKPDRQWENEYMQTDAAEFEMSEGKDSWKDKLLTYALLFLILAPLFLVTTGSSVSLDDVTITDCSANDALTSFSVVGTLAEGEKFSGSDVDFDEDTGIAEITLYQYMVPTFLGSRDFVVTIDTSATLKEIWLTDENDKLRVR